MRKSYDFADFGEAGEDFRAESDPNAQFGCAEVDALVRIIAGSVILRRVSLVCPLLL